MIITIEFLNEMVALLTYLTGRSNEASQFFPGGIPEREDVNIEEISPEEVRVLEECWQAWDRFRSRVEQHPPYFLTSRDV